MWTMTMPVLSTAHITIETRNALMAMAEGREDVPGVIRVAQYEEGYFVHFRVGEVGIDTHPLPRGRGPGTDRPQVRRHVLWRRGADAGAVRVVDPDKSAPSRVCANLLREKEMSDPWDYKVEIDAPADDTPCTCGDCGWKGPYADLEQIEHCMLTPGDPSPAGRCPKCGTLAYIDMDEMCCLITGDPISGLSIIGPFDCPEDAQRFADRHRFEGSWWITQLEPPVE